jgi:hypothetical protein
MVPVGYPHGTLKNSFFLLSSAISTAHFLIIAAVRITQTPTTNSRKIDDSIRNSIIELSFEASKKKKKSKKPVYCFSHHHITEAEQEKCGGGSDYYK